MATCKAKYDVCVKNAKKDPLKLANCIYQRTRCELGLPLTQFGSVKAQINELQKEINELKKEVAALKHGSK
jgi:peptidoglycan hydrolase CwlO-like protein